MKKLTIVFILIYFLVSCSTDWSKIDYKNINNIKKNNLLLEEKRKEFLLTKENFIDYKKLNLDKCNDYMKKIFIYNLSICIPDNYFWITPIWTTLDIKDNDDFNDYSSLELINKNIKSDRIYIDIFSNILKNNNLWIIYWVEDNKVFFKEIDNNTFDSSMLIDNWKELIKFNFNIKDSIHRKIIKSIEILKN